MPKALIVDDLEAVHEMLAAAIEPAGFQSVFASSGKEALALYQVDQFDVVLTDMAMEPMDGVTLLREIRSIDNNAKVVLMTGYASRESADYAAKLGAFDFIEKPFRVETLIEIMNRAVSGGEPISASPPERSEAAPVDQKLFSLEALRKSDDPARWPTLAEFSAHREKAYLDALVETFGNDRALAARIAGVPPRELP